MRRFLSLLLITVLLSGTMSVNASNDWTMPMYTVEGAVYSVPGSESEAYNKIGLYYTPVSRVFARNGANYIVPLNEVINYRAIGCLPIHAFLFEATFEEICNTIGPFEYVEYYPGTPFSGDLPRHYYQSAEGSIIPVESIGIYEGKCVDVTLKLKDVFPYLSLFTDEYGKLTINQIMNVFQNNNLYGLNYRIGGDDGVFSSLSQPVADDEASWYFFDYDRLQISIERGWDGNINYDTARCGFNVLL